MTFRFSLSFSNAAGLLAADGSLPPAEQSTLAAALKASLVALMPALARPSVRFVLSVSATAASGSTGTRGLVSTAVAVAVVCSLVPEQLSSMGSSTTASSAFSTLSSIVQASRTDGRLAALVLANAADDAVLQTATISGVSGISYTAVVQKTTGPTGQPTSRPSSLPSLATVNPPPYASTSLLVLGVCLGFGVVGVAALVFYLYRRSGRVAPQDDKQDQGKGQGKARSRRIRVDPNDPEMMAIVAGSPSSPSSLLGGPSSPGPWTRLAAMTQAWTPKRGAKAAAVAPAPFLPFDFIPSSNFMVEAAGGGRGPADTRPVTPDDDEEGEHSIDLDSGGRDETIRRIAQKLLRPRREERQQGQRRTATQRDRRRRRDEFSSSEEDDSSGTDDENV